MNKKFIIQKFEEYFKLFLMEKFLIIQSFLSVFFWLKLLKKDVEIPEQKPEIKINKELSHIIFGAKLRIFSRVLFHFLK
jgi:hypothetical protein